jgi:valyl-tRNA synthetase
LDTWFSSALWPFSTLGWPENTDRLKTFYPTSVLVTGFDIIFFWVARMIMFGLKFQADVPFKEIYIHGLVRDGEGQKMSKSKGNVLDPLDLIDGIDLESLVKKRTTGLMQPEMARQIEQATRKHFPDGIQAYGTDALRFTFAALASTGRDIRFDTGRIEGYRNFCNKLWNASRYVLMNTEGHDTGADDRLAVELSLADQWIISALQELVQTIHKHFKQYRFDLASQALYDFVWNEYCDWYLEFSKPVINNDAASEAALRGTRQTLLRVLETLLRLLHPIMPFITEELWHKVAPLAGIHGDSIMLRSYPQADDNKTNPNAEAEIAWLKQVILGVRRIRAEMDIAPSKQLSILCQNGSEEDQQRLVGNDNFLKSLARLASITWLESEQTAPESAAALAGDMQILIPLAGLIDKAAEWHRLSKEIDKINKELAKCENKLNNPNFVERAPAAVLEQEQQRLADYSGALEQLQGQLEKIKVL